jgi:twinkle protein
MGTIVNDKLPCPRCGSSQGYKIYEDGSTYCYAADCDSYDRPGTVNQDGTPRNGDKPKVEMSLAGPNKTFHNPEEFKSFALPDRKISKEVTEFFKVTAAFDSEGNMTHHHYPYDKGSAFKIRKLEDKKFMWANGKSPCLFGYENFQEGGKRVIITEGEIDCMAVAQASLEHYGKIYPVVGLSSSGSATASGLHHRDFLRSFKEVIIMMDEDDAGEEAARNLLKIVGYDKAKIAHLPLNDPSDVLKTLGSKIIMQSMFDAQKVTPAGILTKKQVWNQLLEYNKRQSISYPPCMAGINRKTKGKRGGEIALFVSGTSAGKSTLLREDLLHTLQITSDKVGVVSLEEAPAETARKLAGMALSRNPAVDEIPIEDIEEGFESVWGTDGDERVILMDHQGAINDDGIIDKLEYMILLGAKHLYLDHITILVSEGAGNLTGNEAIDKVMNDLLRLVKKYPEVWIGLISHLRKTPGSGASFEEGKMPSLDDIKGSGSIKQISFDVIGFARNLMAETEAEKNVMKFAVLKCRYTGLTGEAGAASYDINTGRLSYVDPQVTEL